MVLAMCLCAGSGAQAEKRVALIIGNANYAHAPILRNPANDAAGMAAALSRLGFDVIPPGIDLSKAGVEEKLGELASKLRSIGAETAIVVFFYSGHGFQVNGRNYIWPVDARLEDESDIHLRAVPVDTVQKVMEGKGPSQTNIIILDACRDNPLDKILSAGGKNLTVGSGLAVMRVRDALIVYATQPGFVAADGDRAYSPFTEALLRHIETPGIEIRSVMTRVRNEVLRATADRQEPWDHSSLRKDIFLAGAPSSGPGPAPPPNPSDRGPIPPPPPVPERVPPPQPALTIMLGMKLADLSPELRQRFGIRDDEGVVVTEIGTRSEAYDRGIRPGDRIIEMDLVKITTVQELAELMKRAEERGKNSVQIMVRRGEQRQSLTLHIGDAPIGRGDRDETDQ
jgi:hypothetical protein